ncbi:MAG TPA: DUF1559 domain-containing protein, partial [Lacipirellulaceae bacterium]|nr:DUF1559 domain-containing protein [Lacipirellulaceae bacterium]
LTDQPLMRNVLADLALESEAATLLALRLAHAGDAGEGDLSRLGVAPVADAEEPQLGATHVGGYGSYHPGVIIAAFADGSTRAISENVDRELLRRLGHRADGEIIDAHP